MDGEFSRVKDKLYIHLKRHDSEADDYEEVVDSPTFGRFGKKYLAKPSKQSGIEKRTFVDLKKEDIEEREDEVNIVFIIILHNNLWQDEGVKSLTGISGIFQYICKPNGEVLWRKLPCFCSQCNNMEWEKCLNKDIVGGLKLILHGDD